MWEFMKMFGPAGLFGGLIAGVVYAAWIDDNPTNLTGAITVGAIVGFGIKKVLRTTKGN